MTGLLVDGRWVAPLEIADGFLSRLKGLMGRQSFDGALLIRAKRSVASVHTLGMRFPIDVAFCTNDLQVVAVRTLQPMRGSSAVFGQGVTQVVEAEAGAMARWGIVAPTEAADGSQLSIEARP